MFNLFRKPPNKPHVDAGAEVAIIMRINELTHLAELPPGSPHAEDYEGNSIVWDQTQLDATNAEIVRLKALLTEF